MTTWKERSQSLHEEDGTTPIHSHTLGVERHVGRLLVNDPLPSLAVLYVLGRQHELVVLVLFAYDLGFTLVVDTDQALDVLTLPQFDESVPSRGR